MMIEMSRLTTMLLFTLLTMAYAQSQSYNIDSLKQVLEDIHHSADSIQPLDLLVQAMASRKQFDEVLPLAERLYQIALVEDSTQQAMIGARIQGEYYDFKGLDSLALDYYHEALQLIPPDNAIEICGTLQRMAHSHTSQGRFEKAMELIDKAINTCGQPGLEVTLARLYGQLAALHMRMNNMPQAINNQKKNLYIMKAHGNNRSMFISYYSLGQQYRASDSLSIALEYLDTAQTIEEIYNIPFYASALDIARMQLLVDLDSIDQAGHLAEQLYEQNQMNEPNQLLAIITSLSSYYLKHDRNQEALVKLQQGIEIVENLDRHPQAKKMLYDMTAKAYRNLGNYEKSTTYFEKTLVLSDSIFNKDKLELVQEYEAKYELQEKELAINERDVKLAQQQAKINRYLSGSILLLLLSGFYYYRYRKNKIIAETEINNLQNQQKVIMLDAMLRGQDNERKRIAQDLHDGLGGLLTIAHLHIQKIKTELKELKKIGIIDNTESLLKSAHQEVRRISHDMMPAALVELGLRDAIQDLVLQANLNNQAEIVLSTDLADGDVEEVTGINVYRILQELLNNAIKYSNATVISLDIKKHNNQLLLDVRDNGIGFNTQDSMGKDTGIGLKNLMYRVEYLNGSYQLHSKPNQGTNIQISVPLKR